MRGLAMFIVGCLTLIGVLWTATLMLEVGWEAFAAVGLLVLPGWAYVKEARR